MDDDASGGERGVNPDQNWGVCGCMVGVLWIYMDFAHNFVWVELGSLQTAF